MVLLTHVPFSTVIEASENTSESWNEELEKPGKNTVTCTRADKEDTDKELALDFCS